MTDLEKKDFMIALVEANLVTCEFQLLHACRNVGNTTNLYFILADRTYPIFSPSGYIILASIRAGDNDIICFAEL